MRVRLLKAVGRMGDTFPVGAVQEVSDGEGATWIGRGIAEAVDGKPDKGVEEPTRTKPGWLRRAFRFIQESFAANTSPLTILRRRIRRSQGR